MRNEILTLNKIEEFIKSDSKHCLIKGTNVNKKHLNILKYLNSLGKKLRILIRINSMQNSETFLGYNAKTNKPRKIGNLNIYVDSMQASSQKNTPREFSYIIVYPIESLKGISDKNIDDILNHKVASKIFWISHHDSTDYSYIKEICDIKSEINIDSNDDVIHNNIKNNTRLKEGDKFDKLLVEGLSYYNIEDAINETYKMGGIYTSSMGQELIPGSFGNYTFGGHKSTKVFNIKVKEDKEDNKYILLVSKVK